MIEDSDSSDSDESVITFPNEEHVDVPEISDAGDDGIAEHDFIPIDDSSSLLNVDDQNSIMSADDEEAEDEQVYAMLAGLC